MNVNEVLANRANQLLGSAAGTGDPVDASRDVNMGQSLGSTFTASMFISTVIEIEESLAPHCSALARTFEHRQGEFPLHSQRLRAALGRLDDAEGSLHELGADSDDAATAPRMQPQDWQVVVAFIAVSTARPFIVAPDGFTHCGSVDAMVAAMAAVRGLAIVLLDIAVSIHASGITQAAAAAMLCRSVIGQDQVVAAVACQGTAAACMARPLIVSSVLNSLHHLGECVEAIRRMTARLR
jgi:fumarate hydratase class II